MCKVLLLRQQTSDEGTFGLLTATKDGASPLTLFTGELPWRDNTPTISCIPQGVYKCIPWHSRKYPNHYNVTKVVNRSAILIHSGNFSGDASKGFLTNVQGCILVGKAFGSISGQKAVLSSKPALNALRSFIGENEFTLEIKGVV